MLDLYVISGRRMHGLDFRSYARACARGGARMFQVREKDLPDAEVFRLSREAMAGARGTRMKVLVNGRWDIALAAGAHGVHLGARSLPVAEVRHRLGPGKLIGYSAHGLAEARRAQRDGADFVTLGPVFPVREPWKGPARGPAALRRAARTLRIPVFALGGIRRGNVHLLHAAGLRGAAVISAAARAASPQKAVAALRRAAAPTHGRNAS